jgi:hypothetical protein
MFPDVAETRADDEADLIDLPRPRDPPMLQALHLIVHGCTVGLPAWAGMIKSVEMVTFSWMWLSLCCLGCPNHPRHMFSLHSARCFLGVQKESGTA